MSAHESPPCGDYALGIRERAGFLFLGPGFDLPTSERPRPGATRASFVCGTLERTNAPLQDTEAHGPRNRKYVGIRSGGGPLVFNRCRRPSDQVLRPSLSLSVLSLSI